MSRSKKRRRSSSRKAAPPPATTLLPWLLGGAAILIGVVILVALANRPKQTVLVPSVGGGPSAAVENEVVDHGVMKFNTTTTSVFTIRNAGDQPLTIIGVPRVEVVEGC